MAVYLIHLERPICPGRPAQHYLGYAACVSRRLAEHRASRGARMLAAAVERGIGFEVVRKWAGGRGLEVQLKRRKRAWALCPICVAAGRRR